MLISFGPGNIFGAGSSDPKHEPDDKKANQKVSAIAVKLDSLIAEFCYEIEINNNDSAFDSIAIKAINLAESTFDHALILKTNLKYLDLIQMKGSQIDFDGLVGRTEDLALKSDSEESIFNTWVILSKCASRMNHPHTAQKYALKAISEATFGKKPEKDIQSHLIMGKSLEIQNQLIEAYQNYLNALYHLELIDNAETKLKLEETCYQYLFEFHSRVKDYDQAAQYKNKHLNLFQSHAIVDSVQFYWASYDLCGLAIRAKKYGELTIKLNDILSFADREHNKKLKDYTLSIFRSYLIQSNNFSGFNYLYNERYPEDLEHLEKENPVLYFQTKARIAEFEESFEKANTFYKKAENIIEKNGSPVYRSNFYKRYGQFLLRNNKSREAMLAFENSYQNAEKGAYLDYIVESSKSLDSLHALAGNFNKAYKYANIHTEAILTQNKLNKQEEFLMMELSNESKRMSLVQKKLQDKQKKKFNLQYLMITIGISILFLIFIILSSFKVPEWAIRGLGFVSVLMLFEFIILILDYEIHHLTHGAPLWIFTIKVLILFVLFPLHHLIEDAIIKYMINKKLLGIPKSKDFKNLIHTIWPWMGNKSH